MPRDLPLLLLRPVLGWFRWTQTVPMILAWAFTLGVLALFAIINFQNEGIPIAVAIVEFWERNPWLPRADGLLIEGGEGALVIDSESVRGFVLALWGTLAGVFYLVSMLADRVLGPREPRPLARKLRLAAGAGAIVVVAFLVTWATSDLQFNGPAVGWIAVFAALGAFPTLVSAYSLTVGHALDAAGSYLASLAEAERPTP